MSCPASLSFSVIAALVCLSSGLRAAEIAAEKSQEGAIVKIDGQLFTEYRVGCAPAGPKGEKIGSTPILWPIIGPTGKPMTRAYPMGKGVNEREDHVHHRSMWFNHGSVNGLSFWDKDTIRHREFVKIESGAQAVIVTRNDWLDREGGVLCDDERTLKFGVEGESRRIDFDVTIKAGDKPVTFGDTKEGSFGIRVAETMKVDAKLGGRIVNSEGLTDKDAWAKRASWVDYHGPIDGETVGVAVLNHPSSFRYPTYWHVRTYGLFAANPFGVKDFGGAEDGAYTLKPGETMSFRYRVLFHKGDEKATRIAEAFESYSKEAR